MLPENNQPKPLVSIMMPAYNAEGFIDAAIESILSQTMSDWELIVINDGSTDKTAEILNQYDNNRIRIFHQENSGEAAARNHALEKVKGKFLAFLDSDDQFLPNFLEEMVTFLESHPSLDGVYCDGYYIDTSGNTIGTLSSQRRGPFEGSLYEAFVRASDVFGPPICALVRSKSVQTAGVKFDSRIVIGPDWDYFTHLSQTTQFGYYDKKLVRYRVHTTNITVTAGDQKRRNSLAICREKAIKTKGFNNLELETRTYAFYDLLINILFDDMEKQDDVTGWVQFKALPSDEQARLYRLMSSQLIKTGVLKTRPMVSKWLRQARLLNPRDLKTLALVTMFKLMPGLSVALLQKKDNSMSRTENRSPFSIRD